MNEMIWLSACVLAGAALGAVFFEGLHWTVKRGLSSTRPALWFAGSFVVRTAVVMAGFFLLARGGWPHLLAGLTGFFFAKLGIVGFHRFAPQRD